MKKVTALCLAVLLAFSVFAFAGCGEKAKDTDSTASTEQTSSQTAAKGNFTIYSDNSFAPFEFLDEKTGKYTGVDMDILAAIAEDQGFTYDMKNEGFDAAMGAVQAGQADGMIAGMTINDDRKKNFDFSEGYFDDCSMLVVAKNSDIKSEADLKGKKIAAKKGTVSTNYAESIKDTVGFEITYFEDSPTMYQAVITGSADACFEDRSVIGWAIQSEGVELQTVSEVNNGGQYGFAVKKGQNAELLKMFNDGLANIKSSGKYDEILAKYGY